MGKFGGKGKGGLQQASNNSSVSGLDQLNMSDKDINVSTPEFVLIDRDVSFQAELEKMLLTLKLLQANWQYLSFKEAEGALNRGDSIS